MTDLRKGTLGAWGSGLIGVIIFSGSLPATRVAVLYFAPAFVTAARAAVAALVALALVIALRPPAPRRSEIGSLTLVSGGVVIGFPFLTGLALTRITAAQSLVFIGLLPLSTALFARFLGGERPRPAFWVFSLAGSLTVAAFAYSRSSGGSFSGDMAIVAAILLCGLGYAEGARLARRLGGWQVISWTLLFSLPVTAPVAFATWVSPAPSSWQAWVALAYLSFFSMMLGFVFWYRGLALGGTARVSQLQLFQPFLGLLLAALVLGEPLEPSMLFTAGAVLLCVAGARRFG